MCVSQQLQGKFTGLARLDTVLVFIVWCLVFSLGVYLILVVVTDTFFSDDIQYCISGNIIMVCFFTRGFISGRVLCVVWW